ncbi:MAG: hypothetical protein AAGL49_10740, partial [Pseudomonadota bacterium]
EAADGLVIAGRLAADCARAATAPRAALVGAEGEPIAEAPMLGHPNGLRARLDTPGDVALDKLRLILSSEQNDGSIDLIDASGALRFALKD